MSTPFNYEIYQKLVPYGHDAVIDHVINKFLPNSETKRPKSTRHNYLVILDATFKLSAIKGFSNMSMRDLVKEAGISSGNIYHYFASKEALEQVIVEGLLFVAHKNLDVIERDDPDPEVQLLRILKGHIFLAEMFQPWYNFVFQELRSLKPENMNAVNDLQIRYLKKLAQLLNGNFLIASHLGVIVQDWYLKKWKYQGVKVDDFADHCMVLANALKQQLDILGDQHVYKNREKMPAFMK